QLSVYQRIANALPPGRGHLSLNDDLFMRDTRLAPPLRSHADFTQVTAAPRLALDGLLHPFADGQTGGEHEAAEDDAQRRQQRARLLLQEGFDGQTQDVGETQIILPHIGRILNPSYITSCPSFNRKTRSVQLRARSSSWVTSSSVVRAARTWSRSESMTSRVV